MTQPKTHDPSILEQLFGATSATARILDFLSTSREWDYNKTDIAQNSNISQKHVTKALNKLEKLELVKKTRTIGRSEMYQYNMQNKAAELLERFSLELAGQEAQKIADQELAKLAAENPQIETPA